jgi:hypothetical protein
METMGGKIRSPLACVVLSFPARILRAPLRLVYDDFPRCLFIEQAAFPVRALNPVLP